MANNAMVNNVLTSMDIIAKGVVEKHKYDRTVEAKIVSDAQKSEGIYKVEYETTIFDAYSDGQYYKGDIVYVVIPQDDYTRQKYIVGRKIDKEKEPSKTFNFRLPFDNFIGLNNLMDDAGASHFVGKGYLANKPEHGMKAESEEAYQEAIATYQKQWNDLNVQVNGGFDEDHNLVIGWREHLDNHYAAIENWFGTHSTIADVQASIIADIPYDYTWNNYQYPNNHIDVTERQNSDLNTYTVFDAIKDAIKYISSQYEEDAWYNGLWWHDAIIQPWQQYYLDHNTAIPTFGLTETERAAIIKIAANQHALVNSTLDKYVETEAVKYTELLAKSAGDVRSINHLWSWHNDGNEERALLESTLGIEINVQTLLDIYKPRAGKYGLRILITGRTPSTEDAPSALVTQELYFTNEDMYGNTYGYYEPFVQQKLFNISNLQTLHSIDIYFWQDHQFTDQFGIEIPYTSEMALDFKPNIIFDNLRVLLGLTVEECQSDRVFLYTYDDLHYGLDPLAVNEPVDDTKLLRMAWVHVTADGPVLVDHAHQWGENDTGALDYWSEHAGGASIHWYHYEYGCDQNNDNIEERWGGINWKHQPEEGDDAYQHFQFTVHPDSEFAHEYYKVVVALNNVPQSAEITFYNRDVNAGTPTFAQLNEVVFRLLRQVPTEVPGQFNIVEDPGLTTFDVYDEHSNAMMNADNVNASSIWYYIQVWIRNNDTGEYSPMTYDTVDGFSTVEWEFPQLASMICDWAEVTPDELTNATLAPYESSLSNLAKTQLLAITRKFHIQSRLLPDHMDNTIGAVVKRRGNTYHPQINLLFGKNGTMGSNYTVSFYVAEPGGTALVKDVQFSIAALVKDRTGNIVPNSKFIFSWELLAPTIITESRYESIEGKTPKDWTYRLIDSAGFCGNTLTGYIRNDYPPILRVTVRGVETYPLVYTQGFRLTTSATASNTYTVTCVDRIEFKSDGSVPIADTGMFGVRYGSIANGSMLYPEWSLHQFYKDANDTWQELDPPEFFALKQDTAITQVNISSQSNPRIYHYTFTKTTVTDSWLQNSGTLKDNVQYPDLDRELSGTDNGINIYSTYKELKDYAYQYYQTSINYLTTLNLAAADKTAKTKEIEDLYNERISRIDDAAQRKLANLKGYRLDPYTQTHTTGDDDKAGMWVWDDSFANRYYTYVGFGSDGVSETILGYDLADGEQTTRTVENEYYRQAIPFVQNVYSSSLINSWDGKYYFDDTDGVLMSQAISAGTKDSSTNTFTGVLMGNWTDWSDDTLKTPGIYGILKGKQAFGFKTDGTGFIGANGHGRIEFDGNNSLISNSDKSAYINLDPITYTINTDNSRHLTHYNGYSPYFLYAEAYKTSTASIVGEDELEQSTLWAQDFMNDPGKDYFIVDPNNGVLTTGGIISRYGKIGNWLISSQGLYQKYTGASDEESRYMYLGYPSASLANVTNINNQYQNLIQLLENERDQKLQTFNNIDLEKEVDLLQRGDPTKFVLDPMHWFNAGWPYKWITEIITMVLARYTTEGVYENTALSAEDLYLARRDIFDSVIFEYFGTPSAPKKLDHTTEHLHYDQTPFITTEIHGQTILNTYFQYSYNISDNKYNFANKVKLLEPTYPNLTVRKTSAMQAPTNIASGTSKTYAEWKLLTAPYENLWEASIGSTSHATYSINGPSTYYIDRYYKQRIQKEPDPAIRAQMTENFVKGSWNQTATQTITTNDGSQVVIPVPNVPQWQVWGAPAATNRGISRLRAEDLEPDYLLIAQQWCNAAYQFANYNYQTMLREILEVYGVSFNDGTKNVVKQTAEQEAEAQAINKEYAERISKIKTVQAATIDRLVEDDKNRYAIWCGYKPASDNGYPLFSVNWRGSMSAREALLGYESPWLVMDYGLTQSNNFGTIFLGNPKTPYSMSDWVHYGDNLLTYHNINNENYLSLNTSSDANEIKIVSLKNDTSGDYCGPQAYGTYGEFAIQAGNLNNDRKIHFGVRMDGTLFSDRGMIGGWRITDKLLVNYYNDDPKSTSTETHPREYIALDTAENVIRLYDSQIVLNGKDGILYIGAYKSEITQGEIQLASHHLIGKTEGELAYSSGSAANSGWSQGGGITNISSINDQTGQVITTGGNYIEAYSYSIETIDAPNPNGTNKIKGNAFIIGEKPVSTRSADANVYVGVSLDNLYATSDSKCIKQVYFYPIGDKKTDVTIPKINNNYEEDGTKTISAVIGQLGLYNNRWDIYARDIWIGQSKAATQTWVNGIARKLASNIVAVDTASKNAFDTAWSAIGRLQRLISGNWTQDGGYVPDPDNPGQQIWQDGNGFKLSKYLKGESTSGTMTATGVAADTTTIEGTLSTSAAFNSVTSQCSTEVALTITGLKAYVDSCFEEGWEAACASATWSSDKKSLTVTSPGGKTHTFNLTDAFNEGAKTAINNATLTSSNMNGGSLSTQGYHSWTTSQKITYGEYSNTYTRTASCTVNVPTSSGDEEENE